MLAVVSPDSWFGQSWETVSKESSRNPELHEDTDHRSRLPWAILLNVLILSTVIWGRLSESVSYTHLTLPTKRIV